MWTCRDWNNHASSCFIWKSFIAIHAIFYVVTDVYVYKDNKGEIWPKPMLFWFVRRSIRTICEKNLQGIFWRRAEKKFSDFLQIIWKIIPAAPFCASVMFCTERCSRANFRYNGYFRKIDIKHLVQKNMTEKSGKIRYGQFKKIR